MDGCVLYRTGKDRILDCVRGLGWWKFTLRWGGGGGVNVG